MKPFNIFLVLGLLVFIGAVVKGVIRTNDMSVMMHKKCIKTDLYAIGDKGRRHRIYDCTGVDLEKRP